MKCALVAGSVVALALTIGLQTPTAEAQAAQRTDPKAESPAGVIYQIPLDSARRDAAPVLPTGRRDGGAGGPGSSPGGPSGHSGSTGGGQSGSATGGADGASGVALSASGSAGASEGTPQDPSSIHSENGFGSSSQVPGVSQAALRTGAGVTATQAAGSIMPTYLLIGLIALAATGMGLVATRHSRRRDA
jgi:hypothetical protein